jgi:hypothetical protein
VKVEGRDEAHAEGSYYLEWWDGGKRYREAVGPNAFVAAEKMRLKQAELSAVRNGIIPTAPVVESDPERKTLAEALESYKEIRSISPFSPHISHVPSNPRFVQRALPENLR